jgi:hypothetical protein
MAAHVDIPLAEIKMDARQLLLAVNAFLPEDVRLNEVRKVRGGSTRVLMRRKSSTDM